MICDAAGSAYGLGFPHSLQNLPVLVVPQLQVHPPAGLGLPHSPQNLPVLAVPQLVQYQLSGPL